MVRPESRPPSAARCSTNWATVEVTGIEPLVVAGSLFLNGENSLVSLDRLFDFECQTTLRVFGLQEGV